MKSNYGIILFFFRKGHSADIFAEEENESPDARVDSCSGAAQIAFTVRLRCNHLCDEMPEYTGDAKRCTCIHGSRHTCVCTRQLIAMLVSAPTFRGVLLWKRYFGLACRTRELPRNFVHCDGTSIITTQKIWTLLLLEICYPSELVSTRHLVFVWL